MAPTEFSAVSVLCGLSSALEPSSILFSLLNGIVSFARLANLIPQIIWLCDGGWLHGSCVLPTVSRDNGEQRVPSGRVFGIENVFQWIHIIYLRGIVRSGGIKFLKLCSKVEKFTWFAGVRCTCRVRCAVFEVWSSVFGSRAGGAVNCEKVQKGLLFSFLFLFCFTILPFRLRLCPRFPVDFELDFVYMSAWGYRALVEFRKSSAKAGCVGVPVRRYWCRVTEILFMNFLERMPSWW